MAQQKQEQDLNQLLKVRRDKLADLQANGKDPFQITKFNQTHHSMEVKSLYEAHEAELLKDRAEVDVTGLDEEQAKEAVKKDYEERREIMDASPIHVAIAGRMMFKRVMGKASFCNIQDLQGNIQVYVARDAIGADSYADFKKSDIGDIFGLEGFAFRTRTGEISIHAESMTLLSKSLQILPEKFHGLTDTDMRYRQRYVDLIMNQDSKNVFIKRSQILKEIRARVGFLSEVGLDYLSLSRATATLSGGEAQRIRLATQIGSGLVGVAYILDEPSIGLHQRDNDKLLGALMRLRDLGNSLIVVEHDEDTMRAADCVIDIGPGAGEHGGQLVAMGTAEDLMKNEQSVTGAYLSGRLKIPVPEVRKEPTGFLHIKGAAENNLKHIDVDIPLGVMTCITGVSGSGKSSLINEILYKRLARDLNRARVIPGKHDDILGIDQLDKVINIDQSPIGRTPRSNPATYTGVFDQIRDLFAATADAKAKGYKKGRFSFNVKGVRCEDCIGEVIINIEIHFLQDIYVPCEVCKGKRYNRETLEVKYKGKSIYDVLNMTVEEALTFFENVPSIRRKIETLYDVGLSYIRLGQPSTTLSGGEAQRIKLATELSKRSTGKTIYILDEPTTGLHFADVHKLIEILRRLSEGGNTVVVIEHNLDVIKTADHIIDIGPEGGDRGGTVIARGTPEEVAENPVSYTGKYVKKYLEQK